MKNKFVLLTIIVLIGFGVFNLFGKQTEKEGFLTKIRIGWQIPWSTQGQLAQVLKKQTY